MLNVPVIFGANAPGTIRTGDSFSVTCTISSTIELINVTVGCYDGKYVMKIGKALVSLCGEIYAMGCREGMIKVSNGKLNPKGTVIRAEIATILK